MTNETLKKLIQSFVPANDNNSQKSTPYNANVTIIAQGHSQIAIADGHNYNLRPHWWASIAGFFVFIMGLCYAFGPIPAKMAANFSRVVARVARCEHKHVNKVHGELKAKYDYQNYAHIKRIKYYQIMRDLRRRAAVCKQG